MASSVPTSSSAAAAAASTGSAATPLKGFLAGGRGRSHLNDSENNKVPIDQIHDKVVGLFFSTDALAPCRALKSTLLRVYDELRRATKAFEIVMVSMDRDEKGYLASMADAPWLAIPYSDAESRAALATRFGVSTAPALIFFNEQGRVSNTHGIVAVETEGSKAYPFIKDPAAELKEKHAFDAGVLELFNAIDLNHDKQVTRAEILATLRGGNVPGPMIEAFAQQIMADVDKDHSASLSIDEWQAYFATMASRMGGVFPLDGFRKMFGLKPVHDGITRRSSSPSHPSAAAPRSISSTASPVVATRPLVTNTAHVHPHASSPAKH